MIRIGQSSSLFLALFLGSTTALAQGAPPAPVPPGPMQPPPMQAAPTPVWQPPPPQQPGWQTAPPPPPPLGWQQPAPWTPPPAPAPTSWAEAPDPAPKPRADTDAPEGLPLDLRGAIALDTASFTDSSEEFSSIAIRLVASVPVASGAYLDVRLPLGYTASGRAYAVLGNPIVGVRGVTSVGKATWLSISGGVGLPLLSSGSQDDEGYGGVQVPNAFWNIHEYLPSVVPLEFRLGFETEAGPVTLRGELAPVLTFPLGQNDEAELVILHAIEAQLGHTISGGLRLQGVASPTFKHVYGGSFAEGDLYQAAIEPFFQVQRPRYFVRTGLMLPLDSALGPPLATSYGFRLGFGIRLE